MDVLSQSVNILLAVIGARFMRQVSINLFLMMLNSILNANQVPLSLINIFSDGFVAGEIKNRAVKDVKQRLYKLTESL